MQRIAISSSAKVKAIGVALALPALLACRASLGSGSDPGPEVRLRIPEATEGGFSATARRASLECALYVRNAAPPTTYVREPGVVRCRP